MIADRLKFVSLFAGIGGFDLGFEEAGMECELQVEYNNDCIKVLERHWPSVRRMSDVRDVRGSDCGGAEVICGGFPCQDVSMAGKRKGLAGDRSGLFFQMARIVEEAQPEYVVWENVSGLLSSDGGSDFRTVIGKLADIGYFGAWRVLDSQYFGVAQRRRRVFGVFVRGSEGYRRAGAILFEPESNHRPQQTVQVIRTLNCGDGRKWGGNQWASEGKLIRDANGYRRMTPTEVERVAGLAPGHTANVTEYARYDQCGNCVVSNVSYWLGLRIMQVHRHWLLQNTA